MAHLFKKGDVVLFAEQLKCEIEKIDGFSEDGTPCYRIGNVPWRTSSSAILGYTRVNETQIREYPE